MGVLVASGGLLLAGVVVAPAAEAAKAPVRIKTIANVTVDAGATVRIKPRYVKSRRVKIRSAKVKVRRSSTWITRGARSVRLGPGTYRVTTQVSYRVKSKRSWSRTRTVRRTQTLRIVARARIVVPPAAEAVPNPVTTTPTPPPTPTPTLAPASIASTGSPCDSTSLVKANGSSWVCSFSEEFAGTSLDTTRWLPQETATSDYTVGGECHLGGTENVAVGGGVLSLTVRKEPQPFQCQTPSGSFTATHTGGMVSTWDRFTQARGRFEIRAAFPATTVPGHHSALWLYPESPEGAFPISGEIDIAEMYSQWWDRVIPFVHYLTSLLDPTVTNNWCMITNVSDFHTYTLEWTSTSLTIAYDGVPCVTHRINGLTDGLGASPFDKPFMLALTQGLGLGQNAFTGSTPEVGTTKVDYVRVWK